MHCGLWASKSVGIAKPKVWGFKELLLNRVLMQQLFVSVLQAIKRLKNNLVKDPDDMENNMLDQMANDSYYRKFEFLHGTAKRVY